MGTPPHRQVSLHLANRTIHLVTADGSSHICSYPGIALHHHISGHPTGQVWVPQGDKPDFADDEALITALHDALIWISDQPDGSLSTR
jgi:hypothetical protein